MGARPILPSRGSLTRSSHSPARSASGFHLSAGRQWRARHGRRVIDAITDEGSGDRPRSISPERHPRQRVATADPPRRVDREQRLALEAWRAADSSQPAPSVFNGDIEEMCSPSEMLTKRSTRSAGREHRSAGLPAGRASRLHADAVRGSRTVASNASWRKPSSASSGCRVWNALRPPENRRRDTRRRMHCPTRNFPSLP
jgi:hypothetical protein